MSHLTQWVLAIGSVGFLGGVVVTFAVWALIRWIDWSRKP
jgi:S1-C subfamily serine protease